MHHSDSLCNFSSWDTTHAQHYYYELKEVIVNDMITIRRVKRAKGAHAAVRIVGVLLVGRESCIFVIATFEAVSFESAT